MLYVHAFAYGHVLRGLHLPLDATFALRQWLSAGISDDSAVLRWLFGMSWTLKSLFLLSSLVQVKTEKASVSSVHKT